MWPKCRVLKTSKLKLIVRYLELEMRYVTVGSRSELDNPVWLLAICQWKCYRKWDTLLQIGLKYNK
jgi:hypothetical protein